MAYNRLFSPLKNVHDYSVLLQLFIFCLILHVSVLTFFFYTYQDRILEFKLLVSGQLREKAGVAISFVFEEPPTAITHSTVSNQVSTNGVTLSSAKEQTLASQTNNNQNKTKKQQASPSPVKSEQEQKSEPKKSEQQQVKPESKKQAEPKQEIASKEQAVSKEAEPLITNQTQSSQSISSATQLNETNQLTSDPPIDFNIKNGTHHLSQELTLLHEQITRAWTPPPGLPAGCACSVQLVVGLDGSIDQVEIVESSGIIMFDIIARNTMCAVELPSWCKGRSITITFS